MDYTTGNRILNNAIRLGVDSAGNAITGDHAYKGISVSGTYNTASHNSVYIGGTGNYGSYAFVCTYHPHTVTNNIFFNDHKNTVVNTYKNYGFYYSGDSIQRVNTNYNIYYATGTSAYLAAHWRNYTTYEATTIEQWRSISKQDSNSMTYNPNFKNPKGNAATGDLHLANPNPAEGQGGVDATVTDDIDGEIRSSFSPTDIGADAGNFTLQDGDAPILTHATFVGQVISAPETYSVKITDNGGGVDTAGNNKPRMWYRKKYPATGNWVSVPGVLQSGTPQGGQWGFTPDLSLAGASFLPGDSLDYYFVAQDKGPLINLGYSNKPGTAHTTVNTQITAPSNPLQLLLMGYFADTVYVGTGQTYPSLTNAGGFFEASNKMCFTPAAKNPVVYITSDLIGETAAFRFTNLSPSTAIIRMATPTATVKKISSLATTLPRSLITLGNAHHLLLDGTVNGSGRYLQFASIASNPSFGRGALSVSDAEALTVQNCIFEGNLTNTFDGGVVFVSTTNTLRGFRFVNNLVRNIESGTGAGLPHTAMIFSAALGDTAVIRNNEFVNFGSVGLAAYTNAINGNLRLYVDSNHFYYNSAIAPVGSRTGLLYGTSKMPSSVTNNYVGGSAPFCGGAPWTFTTQATGSVAFKGLQLDLYKDSVSQVRNNVVRNVHINAFGYMFYGLLSTGDVTANFENNVIGDPGKDSSVLNKAIVYGLYCTSGNSSSFTPELSVRGNLVAGLTAPTVEGIHVEAKKATVQGNRVTRVHTSGFATGIAGFKGMMVWLNNGSVLDNEISNLVCLNAPGWTYGMEAYATGALPNEMLLERNRIFDLQSNGGSNTFLSGFYLANGQYRIRNNTVSLTNGTGPAGTQLYGLHFQGSAGNVFRNEIAYNTVYIGGTANSTARTAGVYVEGGSPVASFRNNLLYNERSGTGTHLALAVLPASGVSAWDNAKIPNHNFYVTNDSSAVNEWRSGGVLGMPAWRAAVRGDSASYASTVANLPAASFFRNAAAGDLHINNDDTLCWYVNGKGQPLGGISGDMDSAAGVRSTAVANGATDIGADEFTTLAKPPRLVVSRQHQLGGTDTLSQNGKILATITWGTAGTLPTLGEARYYSGVWPNDTTNNGTAFLARFFNAYWDIPATGGSGYSYSVTLHYDSSIIGRVTDLSKIILNKRQSATPGTWTALQPTIVDTVAKTITVHNLTSFSEFTATDLLATLAAGVALPDLTPGSAAVSPNPVSTGSTFTASVTETNGGSGIAGPHKIHFYLSADNVLTPGANGDSLLGSHSVSAGLAGGANTGLVNKQLVLPCGLTPGTYFLFFAADGGQDVVETAESNNTASVSFTVTTGAALPAPVIAASPSSVVCSGTTVSLTASSTGCVGCVYSWSTGATGPVISVINSGTYTVTATNVCGSASASQAVTVNPVPVVTLTPGSTTVCLGSSLSLTASGAASYAWSGNGLSATTGSSVTAQPTATGTYQYSVTGTSNGCSQTATVTVNVNAVLVLSVTPADTTVCIGNPVTLTASGATTYTWTPGTGLNTTTGAAVTALPASTTVYTVTGTTNGCSSSATRTVSVLPSTTPSVSISYTGCPGSSLQFTAAPVNGGTAPQYQWYANNALQPGSGSGFTLNNAANGTQVYAKLTSNATCASPQTVTSATATVNCITTAVPNIDALERFVLSPNPTKGRLVVQMKLLRLKDVSFTVSTANGKTIYSSGILKISGLASRQIDVSGAASGLYFLQVTIGQQRFTERIVVAR